jgi:hypothetical protein
MGNFLEAVKAGAKAFKEGVEPVEYSIAGRPITCPHCGGTKFSARRTLLNSRVATLVNLDWADASAIVLVCAGCSRIEWFAEEPTEVVTTRSLPTPK